MTHLWTVQTWSISRSVFCRSCSPRECIQKGRIRRDDRQDSDHKTKKTTEIIKQKWINRDGDTTSPHLNEHHLNVCVSLTFLLYLWSPYVIGQTIIFLPCDFYLLSFFFLFSSPNLVDWCLPYLHTWCGLSANLRCMSETCCTRLAGNAGRKKVAKNRHLGTIAQSCRAISSQLRHVSTIGKKLVKQRYVLHMFPQYSELWPTDGWDPSGSLRHPCKFQRVSRLGSVTARHLVAGVSQTLRRWTEGATCVRQGDHHVGHWPTF